VCQEVKDLTQPIYLKDPKEIYRKSFEIVEHEADLERFSASEAKVAKRLIHACGMPDISKDIQFSSQATDQAIQALSSNANIICDCKMVEAGISMLTKDKSNNPIICFINEPSVSDIANAENTTRSAAQVKLWRKHQAGAIVVIGNAPTALFRLIHEIQTGAPMPSIILGFPVGFVGASESKQLLSEVQPTIPHVTLLGRRGGSAIAAAALNALMLISLGLEQI
jgi:precorrin-8X/cobalt-precorrin-8 methylmutase